MILEHRSNGGAGINIQTIKPLSPAFADTIHRGSRLLCIHTLLPVIQIHHPSVGTLLPGLLVGITTEDRAEVFRRDRIEDRRHRLSRFREHFPLERDLKQNLLLGVSRRFLMLENISIPTETGWEIDPSELFPPVRQVT